MKRSCLQVLQPQQWLCVEEDLDAAEEILTMVHPKNHSEKSLVNNTVWILISFCTYLC